MRDLQAIREGTKGTPMVANPKPFNRAAWQRDAKAAMARRALLNGRA
jgi:hypothetical protein